MSTATLNGHAPSQAAPRPSGVRDYISPSRLNLWLKCPLAFKLRYIDGVRTPGTPSQFVGKVVHAVLEQYYRHRQLAVPWRMEELPSRLTTTWETIAGEEPVAFESTAEEQLLQQQSLHLVQTYLKHVPDDEPHPLTVETTLESPLVDPRTGENLGIPLLGIVDIVLDEPRGPLIADFKTAARSSPPLEISHEIQLTSYAWLFRQTCGQTEGGLEIRSLIKTKTPKVEFHAYGARTEQHFARLFAVIRAYLNDLDSNRFVFRPGLGCSMCDFCNTHCRDWRG